MQLTLWRGSDEIGASCVEVRTDTVRLILDVGFPVDGGSANLPAGISTVDCVFISHSHPDHSGLLESLPPDVPVFAGATTIRLIQASRMFAGSDLLSCDFHAIESRKPVEVGDVRVTPYLTDHSAPDAFGFLVENKGKRLFYSGDFRAHGRKASLVPATLRRLPRPVDLLLLEGTLLARDNAAHPSEASVEAAMLRSMQDEAQLVYLLSSSQNLDRLVSAYRATKRAGRMLVLDLYTAWILEEIAREINSTPRIGWPDVRVLAHGWPAARHYSIIKQHKEYFGDFLDQVYTPDTAIRLDELGQSPQRFVLKSNYASRIIDHFRHSSATVLYSMWEGYMKPEHNPVQAQRIDALRAREDVVFNSIHTSGHATRSTLQEFVRSLEPVRIVPIHTEHKRRFPEFFDNVTIMEDGQSLTI